ncbi:alpha/beta fold hydrolase [bacterium]|nr:alpha/beta fold hydrolase [bacterium]
MKKFVISAIFFILIFLPLLIPKTETSLSEQKITTSDNVEIAYDTYNTNHKEVVILAHGWLMTKNSKAFSQMAKDFSKYYDVIVLDYRGHGKSSGKYTFGAKEINDLKPIIDLAHKRYKQIYLIGFSLGSLISVDYCSKYKYIDKLILVSAPVSFEKIENNVLSPYAFIPTLKKFEWDRWTSIRFGNIFDKKIKPIDEISKINIPILFIAGEKDPVIYAWHNEELYKKSKSKNKQVFLMKNGKHAEDLYLDAPKTFMDICIKFLEK